MPVIRLVDVAKTYSLGEVEVRPLREVSLSIEAGEFVALMGPSGSGKTTLMNIIGCMDRPTSGHYVLEDEEVTGLPKPRLAYLRNRRFGFVFQSFNLLARTTAIENVELPLLYWGRHTARERRDRCLEVLDRVGLADRVRHHPSQLSGGQQQRVAIARALVNDPSILLADEPTGNLDSESEREIIDILRDLNRTGMTILLVTHNPEVARVARRRIRIRDGQIREDGP